jgi:putative NADH-flavin reductase
MNLSIIGASSGLGLETVKLALKGNHKVTTLSRSNVPLNLSESLNPIIGNATNKLDLQKAIQNADAILVTIGTRKNMKKTSLFSEFSKTLVEVNKETKIEVPIIFVTGFGTGDSGKYVGWIVKFFLKYFLNDVYADKFEMEEIITTTFKKWICVRPGRLLDKPLTEKYRVETKLYKGINIGGINRANVADFLVKQAENATHLNKFIGLANT